MKKTVKYFSIFVLLFVFMFVGMGNLKALKVAITTNKADDKVEVGKEIIVTIKVTEYANVSAKMDIAWDMNYLECDSSYSQCTSSRNITSNTEIMYKFKGKKDGEATFSVTTDKIGGDASKKITVGNVTAPQIKSNNANLKSMKVTDKSGNELKFTPVFSSGVYEYSMDVESNIDAVNIDAPKEDEKSSVIISDNAKALVAGVNNEVTITVTSESGIKKTYKLNIKRAASSKSDNANLKSMKITDKSGNEIKYTPVFSSTVYEYSMDVESTVEAVNIDVTMEDQKSNVIISNNAKELVAGENNEVTITVTSESGIKKAYKLNIKRAAQDTSTSLSSLKIAEASSFTFDPTKYSYDVKVAKDVKSLTIEYTVSSDKAEVEVQGNNDLEDGSKVKILVTAEDGSKREYTINIVKEEKTNTTKKSTTSEEKNPLIIMGLSIIAFALIGMIIYTIRKK